MTTLRRGVLSLALGALIAGCGDSGSNTQMNPGTAQEGMDAAKSGLATPTDPTKKTTAPAGKPAPAADANK